MPKLKPSKPAPAARRSSCPLACSLDLVGDRWTLLVLRDLFGGKARFGEFLASSEGIPTNILANRLDRLEAAGLIFREPYQQNPPRHAYTLAPAGTSLKPVLVALALWGRNQLRGTQIDAKILAALTSK